MEITVFANPQALAEYAAQYASAIIRSAINERKRARIVAATGTSQFEFLERLVSAPNIDWAAVELFHLDEYIGVTPTHPASFNRYMRERILKHVPIAKHYLLDGSCDPGQTIAEVGAELRRAPIDIAFTGIGENGHLAFNDPPADFSTEAPYLVVALAQATRKQQLNEGWFTSLEDVPRAAITMSIRQILKAKEILCIATGERKAAAVKKCFEGQVSPDVPASILQTHARAQIFLDEEAAHLLERSARH
ncbi:MAG TPA: glucosamine-6-phosphate deaminase [Terriglobales bacterium]|nr:glucosamine-6-phosphate deaminase [Terriglobales bacterium]